MNTKILVVKADTNSEWDNVSALVLPMTTQISEWFKSYKSIVENLVNGLSEDDKMDFNHISLFSDLGDYVVFDEDFEFKPNTPYDFVDSESLNIDELNEPESALDLRMIKFYKNGLSFRCDGKHTGEEFWTERIPYSFFD